MKVDVITIPEQKGTALPAPKGRAPVGEDYDLRDYHPGDSIRSIHWKLSAKRDQLIVRELLASQKPLPVLLFAHLGPPDQLDHTLDRLAALSHIFRKNGQLHEIRWTHPISGSVRRFIIEDKDSWYRCLTAILSDPAPDQGHSILKYPVFPMGEEPIFPIPICRKEDDNETP